MSIALGQLFSGLPCRGLEPAVEGTLVRHITTDSRQVRPDSLFVALPGEKHDGMGFAAEAVARGATVVLAPREPTGDERARCRGVVWIVAEEARDWVPELAARVYGYPGRHLRLHAVTGTNGKTTTCYMLAHILSDDGRRAAFWTTNSVEGIALPFRPHMTTPHAPDLHRFLAEARTRGAQDVLVEVSSHALQLHRIQGLTFQAAAITNITPDHLDFHGSFDAYVEAKASLMDYVVPQGVVALNADDGIVASLAARARVKVVRFGFHPAADVRAEILQLGPDFSRWRWFYEGRLQGEVALPIPGRHNVQNALAALAMALHMGMDGPSAARALQRFVQAPRRLETLTVGGVTVISDVAMNRGSYDAVMRSIAELKRPVVVVNAIRGNRGTAVNQDIAETLADWNECLGFAPLIVTLSRQHVDRLAVDYRVRPDEVEAFLTTAGARGLAVDLFQELPEAMQAAMARVAPGGILLLLGTFGMDDGLALAEEALRHSLVNQTRS